ncbi:MAG: hypothetical protein JKX80_01955 [Candidatus Pacebacteria bacterium]|nr:hypothetical protein [Candidatus Paceibacterota bacterium]
MESNIKASFIPDKMPTGRPNGGARPSSGGGAGDILILIAIVTLAASLALAAGVFLYDRFLDANVQKKDGQLVRAQQAFEPDLIRELVRLDLRLQAADSVLAQHLAPSELFNLLEELTLQSVAYDSLDYSVEDDNTIQIKLKGKARSVNGVALQASVFGQHNAIVNPIFSDLDLVHDGVSFKVSAAVNPSALRYTTVFTQYSAGIEDTSAFDSFDDFGDTFNDSNVDVSESNFGDFGGGEINQ